MPQMLSGIWNQPMPCGRNLWIVVMKLRPVKIDENPSKNTPETAIRTGVLVSSEYGVYSVHPVSRPPNGIVRTSSSAPETHRENDARLSLGNATSGAPSWIGMMMLASAAGVA